MTVSCHRRNKVLKTACTPQGFPQNGFVLALKICTWGKHCPHKVSWLRLWKIVVLKRKVQVKCTQELMIAKFWTYRFNINTKRNVHSLTLCRSVWCYKLICVSRVKWCHIFLKFPDWIKCPSLLLLLVCVCVCVCVCSKDTHTLKTTELFVFNNVPE